MDYKIPFVGDPSVGKTSIINMYSENKFNKEPNPTVGASNFHFTVLCNDKEVNLNVWDTAGQERFRSLIPLYTRGSALVVMVFDMSDPTTFRNIDDWYDKLRHEFSLTCPIVLVGNKTDLDSAVSIQDVKSWAQTNNVTLFFTSVVNNIGIDDLFWNIAEIVSRGRDNEEDRTDEVNLNDAEVEQKKKCC